MLGYIIEYILKSKEDRDNYIKEFKENRIEELCEEEPGCIKYELMVSTRCDNSVFLIEQWENEDIKKDHSKTAHFKKAMELKKKYNIETKKERFNYEIIKYE